ncbi:HPr family phosphocarrier protein [Bacillus sp. FJAT-42376]|uniref:HPr family phosphocarrier protein n=1 Tax=Bacillus sp. FJAT-42376 TaxID=2014076 RepID=UPI000F506DEE|nr:HPr family phosphocarrier protein [Bacillus sp. FJAT-42376]AZB43447.1 HPr family phosphocarrier protein [Bacillus sp. FJAT-42376]
MKVRVVKPVFADPASQLVHTANQFEERILIKKEHWIIDAKSLLGVLALSLQPGEEIEIDAEGSTAAEEALLQLGLFEK